MNVFLFSIHLNSNGLEEKYKIIYILILRVGDVSRFFENKNIEIVRKGAQDTESKQDIFLKRNQTADVFLMSFCFILIIFIEPHNSSSPRIIFQSFH